MPGAFDPPDAIAGVPVREPYESEDAFFRSNPRVAGMATQDNRIALNPHRGLTPDQQRAVAQNEAARVWMRRPAWTPNMELTPEQGQQFASYGSPLDQRSTIIARLISGDRSSGRPTQQQLEFAQALAGAMARYDFDKGK